MHGYKWPINCTRTRTAGSGSGLGTPYGDGVRWKLPRNLGSSAYKYKLMVHISEALRSIHSRMNDTVFSHIIRILETMHDRYLPTFSTRALPSIWERTRMRLYS